MFLESNNKRLSPFESNNAVQGVEKFKFYVCDMHAFHSLKYLKHETSGYLCCTKQNLYLFLTISTNFRKHNFI